MDGVAERLRSLCHRLELRYVELSTQCGRHPSYVGGIVSGCKGVTTKFAHFLATEHNVNVTWLLTGEGEMFRTGLQPVPGVPDADRVAEDSPDHELPHQPCRGCPAKDLWDSTKALASPENGLGAEVTSGSDAPAEPVTTPTPQEASDT